MTSQNRKQKQVLRRVAPQDDRHIYMRSTYTALIRQEGEWLVGWIEEVPGVNCQEASRDELLETLRVTLREALEFAF